MTTRYNCSSISSTSGYSISRLNASLSSIIIITK